MAKWIKFNDRYINLEKIKLLHIYKRDEKEYQVVIDQTFEIAVKDTYKEAEKFVKDFIDEHYIQSEKVG